MATEKRLGRGLESLLGQRAADEPKAASAVPAASAGAGVQRVAIEQVRANPKQPRTAFAERELGELTESVKAIGILQPLVVRKVADGYELIAGERRLRAARMAGLKTVPIIEREAAEDEVLTLALIENLQREDLNAIEKARGFCELMTHHRITQEQVARRIGKDRATVANFIRLLDLPEPVQHIVARGAISMGHARALLGLPHPSTQQALALRIEEEGLSVREVERIVSSFRVEEKPRRKSAKSQKSAHLKDLEDRMRERLGTKTSLEYNNGQGKLVIHLYSDDDLQRILDVLGVGE